ncbi:MAG: HPr family phosphocarrier protein [Calditrichaeota bacterium]|nr:MAG: HPr family phosphocarrier protein [Calditrichota bacterium]
MLRKKFVIKNKNGLHARPADKLVKLASQFKSDIQLSKDGMTVNAKSIMGVLTLAAEAGSEIEVIARGVDEAEALEAIGRLLESDFGEPQS